MNVHAVLAIFKRNLFAYFGSPTGYVFICAFVLSTGLAAFWPQEFFNSNLANLDQLNKYIHLILLAFIPAITMSIWADERRQGTDELLLTLPVSDLEVVTGKYLAAVSIYSASLLFSFSNVLVLSMLGDPDPGLMVSTYVGYWFMGLAMLAVGMVASFLTGNLTVAFVLAIAFNAPLVLASSTAISSVLAGMLESVTFLSSKSVQDFNLTALLRDWSAHAKFHDFSRGVISLSSIIYFLTWVGLTLYLCAVLIGRRHWATGGAGHVAGWHYAVRAFSVALAGFSLSLMGRDHDVRADFSTERLSSLSSQSIKLLGDLDRKHAVRIEAFVSPEHEVPEGYIQTRLNLLTMLDELRKSSGGRITVALHETESFKPEATVAERRFGITAQQVFTRDRGRFKESRIYMGVAVLSGTEKVIIPFVDRGVPVEYELVRSIVSIAQEKPKKLLGIVKTDADLMGDQDPRSFQRDSHPLVEELRKQYDLREVDMEQPMELLGKRPDALLVAQPSSLSPEGMTNLLAAIRTGIPTALFEDPESFVNGRIPGTREPRRPQQRPQMPFGQPPPQVLPKGDIHQLWQLLGITSLSAEDKRKLGVMETEAELWQMATLNLPGDTERREVLAQLGRGFEEYMTSQRQLLVPPSEDPTKEVREERELQEQEAENEVLTGLVTQLPKNNPNRTLIQKLLAANQSLMARKQIQAMAARVRRQNTDLQDRAQKTRNTHVVWHRYNPFPKTEELPVFTDEFVFIGKDAAGGKNAFNPSHDISSGLQYLLMPHAGALNWDAASGLKYEALVQTGTASGLSDLSELYTDTPFGRVPNTTLTRTATSEQYVLAAHITGKPAAASAGFDRLKLAKDLVARIPRKDQNSTFGTDLLKHDAAVGKAFEDWAKDAYAPDNLVQSLTNEVKLPGDIQALKSTAQRLSELMERHGAALSKFMGEDSAPAKAAATLNVVLVTDVDLFSTPFFRIRSAGGLDPNMELDLDVDNVSFLLNTVDYLAGDNRFLEIRKKRKLHRTLAEFDKEVQSSRTKTREARAKYEADFKKSVAEAQKELRAKMQKIIPRDLAGNAEQPFVILTQQQQNQLRTAEEQVNAALDVQRKRLEKKRDEMVKETESDLEQEIRKKQDKIKRMAVVMPPILPLVIGLIIFLTRRAQELTGANARRLRAE